MRRWFQKVIHILDDSLVDNTHEGLKVVLVGLERHGEPSFDVFSSGYGAQACLPISPARTEAPIMPEVVPLQAFSDGQQVDSIPYKSPRVRKSYQTSAEPPAAPLFASWHLGSSLSISSFSSGAYSWRALLNCFESVAQEKHTCMPSGQRLIQPLTSRDDNRGRYDYVDELLQ